MSAKTRYEEIERKEHFVPLDVSKEAKRSILFHNTTKQNINKIYYLIGKDSISYQT